MPYSKCSNFIFVTRSTLLTEAHPVWIVDLGASEHITRDRGAYLEYRRIQEVDGYMWEMVRDLKSKALAPANLACGGIEPYIFMISSMCQEYVVI